MLTGTALAPFALVAIVLLLGTNSTITPVGDIVAVHDGDEVVDLYRTFQNKLSTYDYFFGVMMEEMVPDAEPSMDQDVGNDGAEDDRGSDDYSETNNQVIGVDEMDNVVTDGKYIYTIHENTVQITLAYTQSLGAQALAQIKTIEYMDEESSCPTGDYITGLYVDEDYLVVVGTEYEMKYDDCEGFEDGYYFYEPWYGYNNIVNVYVYDKNDEYRLDAAYQLSGNLIGTRKIDDNLIVVTSRNIPFGDDQIEVDDYLPSYTIQGVTTTTNYEDIVYIDGIAPNSFTTFYAVDIDNQEVDMEVVLGDSGYNLFVSTNNIYLVGSIYYFEPLAEYVDLQEPIHETKTAILKVSIDDADLEYEAMGMVSGYTLNQFSMDEYQGNLRIATTSGWWEDVNNTVYVLNENLEEIGKIDGLGKPNERIKSVRFKGDYGYVVTFLETDPFYVINLVNPENPQKEGELEITGYSSYLQPLTDNFMLGIGYGDNAGGTNGLKISIYDITDKSNPVVFDEVIFDYGEFGWASSTATYNHKDLLVSLSKGIIALPFTTYDYSVSNGYEYNSGILVYSFDEEEGLDYSGYIQHAINSDTNVYVYKIKFIDNYFYTISNRYIKASLISDPEVIIQEVPFE
jgi:uncharacterized secreted protein with C-terminal beta-propeller domain